MSSILNINYPYLYASNQGVDGKRTAGSGFCTNFQKNPWWFVDLKSTKSINSIVAFSAEKNPKLNRKPLKVFLSEDGKSWQLGGHLSDVNIKTPLSLSFHQPLLAQFILIQATGYCHLAMDEIEVYPQDHNTSKRKFNDDQILK